MNWLLYNFFHLFQSILVWLFYNLLIIFNYWYFIKKYLTNILTIYICCWSLLKNLNHQNLYFSKLFWLCSYFSNFCPKFFLFQSFFFKSFLINKFSLLLLFIISFDLLRFLYFLNLIFKLSLSLSFSFLDSLFVNTRLPTDLIVLNVLNPCSELFYFSFELLIVELLFIDELVIDWLIKDVSLILGEFDLLWCPTNFFSMKNSLLDSVFGVPKYNGIKFVSILLVE